MQRQFIRSRFASVLVLVGLTSLAACNDRNGRTTAEPAEVDDFGDDEFEPSELPASETPAGVTREWSVAQGDPPKWQVTAVVIDVGLADLCGIDKARANFDYDSARLDADAKQTIAALAECFADDGPLAGRDVVVIGHADPRGPDDYNRELGMSRADAVAQALTREGLASTRIDIESHGESHAHADPSEWPDDRRVDVQIAG